VSELKMEAELVSNPDLLARPPIEPAMGNSFGSYPPLPSRAININMMTLARLNSDDGGVKAWKVTTTKNAEMAMGFC